MALCVLSFPYSLILLESLPRATVKADLAS